MTKVVLSASFSEGSFASSVRLDISGLIKLGDATFRVQGQFAKGWQHTITWTWIQYYSQLEVPLAVEDHFIEAGIGTTPRSTMSKSSMPRSQATACQSCMTTIKLAARAATRRA
jgi:hypothetical protein